MHTGIRADLGEVDSDRARKVWRDLRDGPDQDHGDLCACPRCLFDLHRSRGGRFDPEAFFLYWLELEVDLAARVQIEELVSGPGHRGLGTERVFIEWPELLRPLRLIPLIAEFLRQSFPDINPNPRRLKVKLWRFKKSGVAAALEEEIRDRERRAARPDPGAWQNLRLAQKIADLVYDQPERSISQRDLQRSAKVSVDRLEDLRGWLLLNYGIEARAGRRKGQVVYRGRMKDSRGRILRGGVAPRP
jgi:hypothetical protein